MNSPVQQSSGGTDQPPPASGRRRLIAESLRVGNPANHARDLGLVPAGLDREQQIELDVDEIRPYDHNPRRTQNPKFAEIKESIRASGIRNPITVTRRPGEPHFIVEAGGNTRLLALQQLWAETADIQFRRLVVLYRPWRAESHVLIAHLIENEQRGDMTFWDKANGVIALKNQLEAEQGRALSVRDLETALKQAGIAISYPTLSYYRFATGRLRALGAAAASLSGVDVTKIQPRLNLIKRYAQSRASLTEDDLYTDVLEPVFRRHADAYPEIGKFSAEVLCGDSEAALAAFLNEPVSQCRTVLDALARSPVPAMLSTLPGGSTAAASPDEATPKGDLAALDLPDVPPAAVKALNKTDAVKTLNSNTTIADPRLSAAVETPGTKPVNAETARANVHQRLIAQIHRFARLVGVGDCLRMAETAPLGLVVDCWPEGQGYMPSPLQHRARWLLALLCGQFAQNLQIEVAGSEHVACNTLVVDTALLCWLFDPQDETAAAFRQIIAALRESTFSMPAVRLCATLRYQPEAT